MIGSLDGKAAGTTPLHLWEIMRRFFGHAADAIGNDHPGLAERPRQATPHWIRHARATHAFAKGVEMSAVSEPAPRVNLNHPERQLSMSDVKRHRAGAIRASIANLGFERYCQVAC